VAGPFNAFDIASFYQRWAHARPLTTSFSGSGGPVQCFRHVIFLSKAGPCETIDDQFGWQWRAHSLFSSLSTLHLSIKDGPMRDRWKNVLHWRLAYSKLSRTGLARSGGPVLCFRRHVFLSKTGPCETAGEMFRIGGWPIRNYRGLVWLAVAGPFDVFDVTSFYQREAHARPPAKCFALAVGPFETIDNQFGWQWRAHSMLSTCHLSIKCEPMQNYRRPVWRAVAGPFYVFDVTSFYQRQAHARPRAKCFALAVGPFETIEDWFGSQWRAHSMFSTSRLFIKDRPMRDRRRNVSHWRLAHSKLSRIGLACTGGPIQCFRRHVFLSKTGPCETAGEMFCIGGWPIRNH
jgi:hypothetical protein